MIFFKKPETADEMRARIRRQIAADAERNIAAHTKEQANNENKDDLNHFAEWVRRFSAFNYHNDV